jgi:hypothetical protein
MRITRGQPNSLSCARLIHTDPHARIALGEGDPPIHSLERDRWISEEGKGEEVTEETTIGSAPEAARIARRVEQRFREAAHQGRTGAAATVLRQIVEAAERAPGAWLDVKFPLGRGAAGALCEVVEAVDATNSLHRRAAEPLLSFEQQCELSDIGTDLAAIWDGHPASVTCASLARLGTFIGKAASSPLFHVGDPSFIGNAPPTVSIGALSEPVYWRGKQWAVTAYGIEEVGGRYAVPKERLRSMDWCSHMLEKMWVDAAEFREAFRRAEAVFGLDTDGAAAPRQDIDDWLACIRTCEDFRDDKQDDDDDDLMAAGGRS